MTEQNNMNYMVMYIENAPSGKGSMTTLIGVYPTLAEASFISKTAKERNKLEFYPDVVETPYPPTTTKVGDYLRRLSDAREESRKARQ